MHMYTYIYVCVCVCVCVSLFCPPFWSAPIYFVLLIPINPYLFIPLFIYLNSMQREESFWQSSKRRTALK